jgi:catechol 2,3-dioxygenase-like lactoylglutathione lyase family enzyme
MFKNTKAFSSFAVSDIQKAKDFYNQTLGLDVDERPEGLTIHLEGGATVFAYQRGNFSAPENTILNFIVNDIDEAVDALNKKGVTMEQYDMGDMKTDAQGVVRSDGSHPGPKAIAWFKDPAGNILSVIQE